MSEAGPSALGSQGALPARLPNVQKATNVQCHGLRPDHGISCLPATLCATFFRVLNDQSAPRLRCFALDPLIVHPGPVLTPPETRPWLPILHVLLPATGRLSEAFVPCPKVAGAGEEDGIINNYMAAAAGAAAAAVAAAAVVEEAGGARVRTF